MDWMQIEAQWEHLSPQVRRRWSMLTWRDIRAIAGAKKSLIAKVTQLYGGEANDAAAQVERWATTIVSLSISDRSPTTRPKIGRKHPS